MKKLLIVAFLGLGIGFSACNKSDSGSEMTRVNVRLTDGPGAYDAIFLNVKEVKVLSSSGESTIAVNATPFNILRFRMGKDTLIASQDIPSGRLQEVRLILNDTGNTVVINGITYPLTTPSGQSSGVKIKVNETLEAGVAYTMLLDFDAAKSIVQTGNGKYILKPVIRAIPNAVSGSITGMISPAASSPKIYAIAGTDTLGTISDATGKFWFPGVAAGTYKVEIKPTVTPYVAKTITDVVVVTGSTKDLGTITIN
ncbi:DUF4382 domain-containing protein [Daejeonella sp.]|uniref:DUF4382 domain-containing protein n=1 Tax=Daejeonella sp. TaxID=2805397 RepID=UPI0030BA3D9C